MSEAPNPFDAFAEAVKPSWAHSRERSAAKAAQTRAKTASEKAADESELLERLWLRGERQRLRDLLAGAHGENVRALIAFLKGMTLESADDLVERVNAATWLHGADVATRLHVLGIIGSAIASLRKREGFDPFDDPLWGQPPNAHAIIKERLGVR